MTGSQRQPPGEPTPEKKTASTAAVRSWAIKRGIWLPPRGRVPDQVRQMYLDAHPDTDPAGGRTP